MLGSPSTNDKRREYMWHTARTAKLDRSFGSCGLLGAVGSALHAGRPVQQHRSPGRDTQPLTYLTLMVPLLRTIDAYAQETVTVRALFMWSPRRSQ